MDNIENKNISNTSPSTNDAAGPLGVSLLNFLEVITLWRRFIVWFVLACTIITTVVALFMPRWYKSTSSVFPAEQADLFSGLEGVGSLVKSFSSTKKLASFGEPTELDRYVAILKSNTVMDSVISKFNLLTVYDVASSSNKMEQARKELSGNTEIEAQDEGDLTISVYDKVPSKAAEMANYYVQLLNDINSELKVQNARGNRIFVEQRYDKNLKDIRSAEDSLKAFQLKFGVIAMPEQIEASIKAGAEVYAELAKKEISLGVLQRTLGEDHPTVKAAEIEIDETKRKIQELNSGSNSNSNEMKILVPFRQTPELGMRYIRLYREVQIQYKVMELLTPLYEQSKVEEQRNTPSVIVLDHALPAEHKAKPKVALFTLLSFVISTAVSLFIVFSIVGLQKLQILDPEKFNAFTDAIRSDWFGLRISRKSRS